jgi:hypothetical protein
MWSFEHDLLHQVVGCARDQLQSTSPKAEFAASARLNPALNILTILQASLNPTNLCKSPHTLTTFSDKQASLRQKNPRPGNPAAVAQSGSLPS